MASDGFYSRSRSADESVGATLHLQAGSVIEAQCYQESGRRQGTALYVLRAQPQQLARAPGTTVLADCVAISDEYYAWWHSDAFGSPGAPTADAVLLHFCTSDVKRCRFAPRRPAHAVHVNRWRPVSDIALGTVPWLTAAHREAITRSLLNISHHRCCVLRRFLPLSISAGQARSPHPKAAPSSIPESSGIRERFSPSETPTISEDSHAH